MINDIKIEIAWNDNRTKLFFCKSSSVGRYYIPKTHDNYELIEKELLNSSKNLKLDIVKTKNYFDILLEKFSNLESLFDPKLDRKKLNEELKNLEEENNFIINAVYSDDKDFNKEKRLYLDIKNNLKKNILSSVVGGISYYIIEKNRDEYTLYPVLYENYIELLQERLNSNSTKSISKFLKKILNYKSEEIVNEKENKKIPHQRIFFGAPGTGKSYKLNKKAEESFSEGYERVTFHPNYMYGQFVGTFKPFPKIIEDKETITYDYIPGILLKTLVKAIKSEEPQLLIIEEINRANTAAVFGDFFQLLDRDSKGVSEYEISTSEDVKLYFKKEFLNENGEIKEGYERVVDYLGGKEFPFIKLPSNLYIWATMNSADQGVMPLDTAFKRRWDFEYIGVDLDEDQTKEFEYYVFNKSKNQDEKDEVIKWNEYREKINEMLSKCGVPEDKLLGPYFISKSMLETVKIKEDEEITKEDERKKLREHIKNKVLMYLYEDAGKPYRHKIFNDDCRETFSKLCEKFDSDAREIFKDKVKIKTTPYKESLKIYGNVERTKKETNNETVENSIKAEETSNITDKIEETTTN